MYPTDLKYTKDHEWVRIAGAEARVGITDYAQRQLGDVVYLELPEVGKTVKKGEVFGTIRPATSMVESSSPRPRTNFSSSGTGVDGGVVGEAGRFMVRRAELITLPAKRATAKQELYVWGRFSRFRDKGSVL